MILNSTLRTTKSVQRHTRGYSLVEMSIVFGVAATILGAVWGVSGIVGETAKKEQMTEQIQLTLQYTRSYYQSQSSICGDVTKTDLTNTLIKLNIIPSEMIRNRTASPLLADHPWGVGADGQKITNGGFSVGDYNSGSCSQQIEIEVRGLKQNSCAALATALSSSSGPSGLQLMFINGKTASVPATVADAMSACAANLPSSSGATLDFVYRLRLPVTGA